jgi:hypothetical protein
MDCSPLSEGSSPIDSRSDQRVPERNGAPWRSTLSKTGPFGGNDRIGVKAEELGGAPDDLTTSLGLNGGNE